jgi:ppGpp synthetase/RelA/SpoT-type nucleotidyltranferase
MADSADHAIAAEAAVLTDLEIELLVQRYLREMARYEEAARLVEDRLRRSLRANGFPRVLLSSRAKHPDDLRGKLVKKRGDARYSFAALDLAMDGVVTDLAGCRLIAYRPTEVEKIVRVVRETLEEAHLRTPFERHDKSSGYRATHVLVHIPEQDERVALRGAICEVQITSLAAHIFNELEHDIAYKDRREHAPKQRERAALDDVLRAVRALDPMVERLMTERDASVQGQASPLRDAEELRLALRLLAGKPLHGDFVQLYRLLDAVVDSLTIEALGKLGSVAALLEQGAARAEQLGLTSPDDVVQLVLGLDAYAGEFELAVQQWRGPSILLKKAIVRDAVERRSRR